MVFELVKKGPTTSVGPRNDRQDRMLSRRRFAKLALWGSVLTPTAAGFYGWQIEPHWVDLVRRDLLIPLLPGTLEGKTLVHLSDLHVGPRVDSNYLIEVFRRVQRLRPDFVTITGDWITYREPFQLGPLQRVLEHLPHGRLGTVGVLGNHDYGRGWRMGEVADQVTAAVRDAGATILRNQAIHLQGLTFVGLEDLWGPHFGPESILAAHKGNSSLVVLCHNPDAADLPVWDAFTGWILAGHTHGGQCKPPFLPPPLLPVRNRRYTAGEFDLAGNRRLYINRGLGHLIQVRFNVRPEITLFRLCGDQAGSAGFHEESHGGGRSL
ncbi:MAG: metallophosphoesterase [Acidobacteriota bacterium]